MARVEDSVGSREELVEFLSTLASRVADGSETVENATTAQFLEATSGWLNDLEGWCANQGRELPAEPSWALVAWIVSAGLIYE